MDTLEKYRNPELKFWDKWFIDWNDTVEWVIQCNSTYWIWWDSILEILKRRFQMKSWDIKNSFNSIRLNGNKIKEYKDLLIPIELENDWLVLTVMGNTLVIRSKESREFN